MCSAHNRSCDHLLAGSDQLAGHTAQASSGVSREKGVHDSHSPAVAAVCQPAKPAEKVIKVSADNECWAKADKMRTKAEKISGIQCMYTGIKEARKVSSPALIENRVKLAQFVNSMYSFEKIHSGKGAALDVTFVSNDRKAAAIRFPPLPPGQETCENEELAPDGTSWTAASRNAAIVLLTQNEGNAKFMRHPTIPAQSSSATTASA